MALPVNVLRPVCRSCQRSLARTASISAQTRYFSASTTRSKSFPVFADTTNEELNSLLSTWNKHVFTPSVLSEGHKKLVYKKSRQHIIENDPGVTVTLSDDKQVKLEPLELFNRPNKRKSLHTLAQILGEGDDIAVWSNLIKFLGGMHSSKEVIPVDVLEKITRKANEVGRQGLIRQAAKEVKSTGIDLAIRPVTRELFVGIHTRAAEGGFAGEALTEALKEADVLTQLLDRDEHCGRKLQKSQQDSSKDAAERHIDMRRDPTVMGVVLELKAAQALEAQNGADSKGEVTRAATRLLAVADENGESGILGRPEHRVRSEKLMEQWIPLAHGLRQTLKVSALAGGQRDAETKLKIKLKSLLDQVDQAIAEERAKVSESKLGRPQRGVQMLEMLQK